ncbi:MAG: hypothetical protein ACI86H_002952 [bacterium]|jgi:hypothetical protein
MSSVQFPYETNKKLMFITLAVLGVVTAIFFNLALKNDQGLILNRTFVLSAKSATILSSQP